MNVQDIELDLSKERHGNPIVRIGQGDSSGTTIMATVYDNGTVPSLSGFTVKMHMRLPDGRSYAEGGSCSLSGNVITCVVDEDRFAVVDGYTDEAYFSLTSGTTVYSTSRFRVKVEKAASKDADPAGMYTDDVVAATRAAREAADAATEAIEQIGTAVDDAQQAAEDAAQAVTDAQTAIQDADAAKQSATTAASQATAAANNANSKANAANTAANNANAATSAANDATTRANSAIDAMGDISEQAVPVMSADVRGGAKIQPNSGLEISGTDNLQVRLALESDGDVRGGILGLTAKGHAEQVQTTGKNMLPNTATSQTINGVTFTVNADGSISISGTSSSGISYTIKSGLSMDSGTYTLSTGTTLPSGMVLAIETSGGNRSAAKQVTFTASISGMCWIYINNGVTVNTTIYPQLELGSTATDYEPYTGGLPSPRPDWEQPIKVVRGRNLFDADNPDIVTKYYTNTWNNGRMDAWYSVFLPVVGGETYVTSGFPNQGGVNSVYVASDRTTVVGVFNSASNNKTHNVPSGAAYIALGMYNNADISAAQLELGSTATPYVPYGHVGMEVRQGSTVLSTTPIPLPSRGWVAGLPDGTADVLTLDGAGHVEWELPVGVKTIGELSWSANTDGTGQYFMSAIADRLSGDSVGLQTKFLCDALIATVSSNVYDGSLAFASSTKVIYARWLSTVGVDAFLAAVGDSRIFYPLATPVTEDCGYVDMPTDIPEGAVIDIPELSEVGIKFFIDSSVTELAKQWYARAHSEYEDRIAALEEAVAELATS